MKRVSLAIALTAVVFLASLVIVFLIVSRMPAQFHVESTSDFATHVLLASILFVTVLGNVFVVSELRRGRGTQDASRSADDEHGA